MTGAEIAAFAAVAAVASAAVSAVGAIQQGKAAEAAGKFNAEVARQQAEQERLIAERDARRFRQEQSRLLARSRALRAGQGVTGEGTPLLVDEATAGEIELGALTIRHGGLVRATRLEQQAQLDKFRGRSARQAGFIRAGSTLLTGASRSLSLAGSSGAFNAPASANTSLSPDMARAIRNSGGVNEPIP